jgi:t-SNARE complex subunit (syntaxin)
MKHETYQKIEQDVVYLQESMDILHDLVHTQQNNINTIEDMIHLTKENTEKGEKELIDANQSSLNYTKYIGYITGGMLTILYFIL